MKILLIMPCKPYPADKGEKIRYLSLLQSLSKIGQIDLIFLTEKNLLKEELLFLEYYCSTVTYIKHSYLRKLANYFISVVLNYPFSAGLSFNPSLKEHLSLVDTDQYDLIFICSANIFLNIPLASFPKEKLYWDLVDCDSAKWQKLARLTNNIFLKRLYLRESRLVRKNEAIVLMSSDKVLLINSQESQSLNHHNPDDLLIIPPAMPDGIEEPRSSKELNLITFSGDFSYQPNVVAAKFLHDQILPLLPECTLYLVGRAPSRSLKSLLPKAIFSGFVKSAQIEVSKGTAYIAPLFDFFGVPSKIFEAVKARVPLIISPEVASQYNFSSGVECLIARTPEEFAVSFRRISVEQELAFKLTDNAEKKIISDFSLKNQINTFKKSLCNKTNVRENIEILNSNDLNPDVSIILPFYNSEKLIRDALTSIKMQTFQSFELIAIDDGSTDNSLSILREITKNWHQRITIVTRANGGSYAARNTGLNYSMGNFIAFYDSDDLWDQNYLMTVLSYFKTSEADCIYTDCCVLDLNNNNETLTNSVFRNKEFLNLKSSTINKLNLLIDWRATIYQIQYGLYLGLQFAVFRREVFKDYRFASDLKNEAEDQLSVIKLLKRGVKFAYLDIALGSYRLHNTNSSAANRTHSREYLIRLRIAMIYGMLRLIPMLSATERSVLRKRIADEYYWALGYNLGLKYLDFKFAFQNYIQGIRFNPLNWKYYKSLLALFFHYYRK